jgi:hypothetical protein
MTSERHVIESISYAEGRIVCSCGATVEASQIDDLAWRDHRRGRPRKRLGRPPRQKVERVTKPAGPRWSRWSPNYRPAPIPEAAESDDDSEAELAYFCESCARWHPILWRHIGLSLHHLAPVEAAT